MDDTWVFLIIFFISRPPPVRSVVHGDLGSFDPLQSSTDPLERSVSEDDVPGPPVLHGSVDSLSEVF